MNRVVKDEHSRKLLLTFIEQQPLPFVCSIIEGKRRSLEQNRLQRLWCNEIAEERGMTPEDVRAYCKLTIGVPILRADSDAFREQYDRILKPLGYEQKLSLMKEPIDLPVTRMMTTEQKTRYLDEMVRHFAEKGIELTMPMGGQ